MSKNILLTTFFCGFFCLVKSYPVPDYLSYSQKINSISINESCSHGFGTIESILSGAPGYATNGAISALDVKVSANTTFSLEELTFYSLISSEVESINLTYYRDNEGIPGIQIGEQLNIVPESQEVVGVFSATRNIYEVKLNTQPFVFEAETTEDKIFWIGISINHTSNVYIGTSNDPVTEGHPAAVFVTDFGWIPGNGTEIIYELRGTCDDLEGEEDSLCQTENEGTFESSVGCSPFLQAKIATDFIVQGGNQFTLDTIEANIFLNGNIAFADVFYYKDNDGFPGELISSQMGIIPDSQEVIFENWENLYDIHKMVLDVENIYFHGSEDFNAETSYWISLQVTPEDATQNESVFWEMTSTHSLGQPLAAQIGNGDWYYPLVNHDTVFNFQGECNELESIDEVIVSVLEGEDRIISVGETIPLLSVVLPENANQQVIWSITNGNDAVSLDVSTGEITGLTTGSATIRATSVQNSAIFDEVNVWVLDDENCLNVAFLNNSLWNIGTNSRLAVDLDVDPNTDFNLKEFHLNLGSAATYVNIIIRGDWGGLPDDDNTIATVNNVPVIEVINPYPPNSFSYVYKLNLDPSNIVLSGGEEGRKYWIEVITDATAWETNRNADPTGSFGAVVSVDSGGVWGLYFAEYVYAALGECSPSLGISEQNQEQLVIYPNPVADILHFNNNKTVDSVSIYDLTGRMVLERIVNANSEILNVSGLPAGVYFLKVKSEKKTETVRFIKK